MLNVHQINYIEHIVAKVCSKKITKGYRTMQYLKIGIPEVSITVLGLDVATKFASLSESMKVNPLESASLVTPVGTPPTTLTISSSSNDSVLARKHSAMTLLVASSLIQNSTRRLGYNRGLDVAGATSPILESVSAKRDVISSGTNPDMFQ